MLRSFLFILVWSIGLPALAGDVKTITRQEYIAMWKDEAIYQMAEHKIPASITLAQGILESGDGNSRLAREGNNHFGIKCHNDWQGKVIIEDDETKAECFRKYDNARDSYEDHAAFLQRKRYEPLFKLDTDDYKGWAKGLKECGYATNPKYPQLLITIVEEFDLHKFDEEGMEYIRKNKMPERSSGKTEPVLAKTEPEKPKSTKNKKGNKSQGDDERITITVNNNSREVKVSDNRIKYVVVKAGDTQESIASDCDLNVLFIRKYNDLQNDAKLKEGQVIYIQPKRNRAATDSYTVKKGDSMWSISQQHGIKLKKLQKLNAITAGTELKTGQTLKLRK